MTASIVLISAVQGKRRRKWITPAIFRGHVDRPPEECERGLFPPTHLYYIVHLSSFMAVEGLPFIGADGDRRLLPLPLLARLHFHRPLLRLREVGEPFLSPLVFNEEIPFNVEEKGRLAEALPPVSPDEIFPEFMPREEPGRAEKGVRGGL